MSATEPALWRRVRSTESATRHREVSKARMRALHVLAKRHGEEFAALFAAEKAELNVLDVEPKTRTDARCERCDLPITGGRFCEFCEGRDV